MAAYPFTTLMPNLGVLRSGGNDAEEDYGGSAGSALVLADMPGLIQGLRSLARIFIFPLLAVLDLAISPLPHNDPDPALHEFQVANPDTIASTLKT